MGGWQSGQMHVAVDHTLERAPGVRIPHHPHYRINNRVINSPFYYI